jgi:hypothetical protein
MADNPNDISYTDAYGKVIDTGCASVPIGSHTDVETPVYVGPQTDTGSNLTLAQTVASHVPHRSASSPR